MVGPSDLQQRILSYPVGVRWAGFESDTHRLQQSGWAIAVDYEPYRQAYRLAFSHRMMRLYAITAEEVINNYSNVMGPGMHERFPMFHIQHCAPSIEVLRITDNLSNFQAMDAEPMMVNQEIQRIEDLNIFNVPMTRTEEILVDRADMSVIEHLEAIKAMQSEEQKDIRERILREGAAPPGSLLQAAPHTEVLANIVSLVA